MEENIYRFPIISTKYDGCFWQAAIYLVNLILGLFFGLLILIDIIAEGTIGLWALGVFGFVVLFLAYYSRNKVDASLGKVFEISARGISVLKEAENENRFFSMEEIEELSVYYSEIEKFSKITWTFQSKKFLAKIEVENDATQLLEMLKHLYEKGIKLNEYREELPAYLLKVIKNVPHYERLIDEIGKKES